MDQTDRQGSRLASIRHERVALGIALLDPSAIPLLRHLNRDHFTLGEARSCWQAICRLHDLGEEVTQVAVSDALELAGYPDGRRFVSSLLQDGPDPNEAEAVLLLLDDRLRRRRLHDFANQLKRAVLSESSAAADLYTKAVSWLQGQEERLNGPASLDPGEGIATMRRDLESGAEGRVALLSGLPGLDRLLKIRPGQLGVIEGRTGEGKSSLASQIALHMAAAGHGVAWWSGEMMAPEVLWRAVCQLSHLPEDIARSGREPALVNQAIDQLSSLPLVVRDSVQADWGSVQGWASRLHASTRKLSVLLIDYMQLLESAGEDGWARLGTIAQQGKNWAMRHNAVVIMVSQMTDGDPGKAYGVPRLGQTRGSRTIEHAADWVLAIYRRDRETTLAELHLLKQRGGPVGHFPCRWDGPTYRFI